jgi:outer membrane protein TolC
MGAVDEKRILSTNATWLDMLSREEILLKKFVNARKELYPDLSLDTYYSRFSNDSNMGDAFTWNESDWGIMLNANYEFDKHTQEQELRMLQIEKNRLLRDKRQLSNAIFKSLREIKSTCKTLQDDLEIESLKQEQAKDSLEVAKIRYERGLSENLDLIDAENAYLAAQINYHTILINLNVAIIGYLDEINQLDILAVKELQE